MPEFSPEQLAAWTGGRWTTQPVSALLGFSIDTRQIGAGQIFVAIKTDKRDGHDFLAAAEKSGASAALVAQPKAGLTLPQLVVADPLKAFQAIAREHRRQFRGPVVGISGSAGKTSTKNLLALLLARETARAGTSPVLHESVTPEASTCSTAAKREGDVLATEGNLNNHLGVPLTLTRLDPQRHHFAVIEAGISGPGEMAPLAAMIEPNVAIITLVAPAHTQELGGLGGVAAEKAVLPAAVRKGGLAIYPQSCAEFPAFRALTVPRLIAVRREHGRDGATQTAEYKAFYSIDHQDDATFVTIDHEGRVPQTFEFRRVSDGMAQNAVLAICAALQLGISVPAIQERLREWQPARLRGELRRENGRLLYLDCYNANPASMADALDAFYAIAPGDEPRLFVLGGMEELGAESEMFHRALGRALRLRPEDFLCVIGDQADAVRLGVLENGSREEQVGVAKNVDEITPRVASWRGAVFVKGSRRYALERVVEANAVGAHG